MMLDFIEENEIAKRIRTSVAKVILDGDVQTYDMKKMKGSPDVINRGAATTKQMANAIIQNL